MPADGPIADIAVPLAPVWADQRPTLRLATAGDVDDGKSTLLGRLMVDTGAVPSDQLAALGASFALAELLDGLEAERAQGITIDVAYRYLALPDRRFIIADAPGHVQYTRNMVTAASGADLALVLVDATKVAAGGVTAQTRRHLAVAALVGLDVVVAVNKMDLVGFSQAVFVAVRDAVGAVAALHGIHGLDAIPVAAKPGDNVVNRGTRLPWWSGPTLLDRLNTAPIRTEKPDAPLRLPIQRLAMVAGAGASSRVLHGHLESGTLRRGAAVTVLPSGERAHVAELAVLGEPVACAGAGQPVSVRLDRELDVGRGDLLAGPEGAALTRRLEADLCWMSDTPWTPGRRLLLKQATRTTRARIEAVVGPDPLADPASPLARNAIARAVLVTQEPVLADSYATMPRTGAFVLIDADTAETAAGGFIRAS